MTGHANEEQDEQSRSALKPSAVIPLTPGPLERAGWRRKSVLLVRVLDAIAVIIALSLTQFWRFGIPADSASVYVSNTRVPYWLAGLGIGVMWWLWLELSGGHDVRLLSRNLESTISAVRASLGVFGAIAIVSYAFMLDFGRSYILVALPLGTALLLLSRYVVDLHLRRARQQGRALSATAIIGTPVTARHVMEHLRRSNTLGLRVDSVFDTTMNKGEPKSIVLGTQVQAGNLDPDTLMQTLLAQGVEAVIVTDDTRMTPIELRRLGWALAHHHVRLMLVPSLSGIAGPRLHVTPVAGMPLVHVGTPRFSAGTRIFKRVFDMVVSALLIVVLSPLLLILALLVKSDGGPALFRHQRIGLRGEPFDVFKFRSMVPNAAQLQEQLMEGQGGGALFFKVKDDPRVTKHGSWMRRFSLDELPQLFNVLVGNMSLVGPRPQVQAEVSEYDTDTWRRLLAKPGMTGLWQVSGRSNLEPDEAIQLDLYYVENWSVTFDISILFRTFRAVFGSDGAY